jgi:chromosome segregation ATPase
MSDEPTSDGVRDRFAARGEEALGKLAQDLLENPIVNGALTRALGAREIAAQAQEVAMGALNIPSASDIERLTRRLRSVSQRLEGIEDGLDRIERTTGRGPAEAADLGRRLSAIEERLTSLSAQVGDLSEPPDQVPRAQERLRVEDHAQAAAAAPAKPPRKRSAVAASSPRDTD